ncbi:hypothetical protein KI387_022836 [Taxus chinensis]|uniref:RING-type E3 ubiquitin transferase n=1 Tax=Taxus chinensis TaxID=29808 RepID=A0AA38L6E6_TAXCH|nr:hypothetical protein KI387_022836 [Taxus chinensis]
MDDPPSRRSAMPVAVVRHGSCMVSDETNHETRTARYPTRIGSSTRVTAVKTNGIEDKEQGQSKTGGRPSSSKSLSQKSVQPVPKLGSSSAAKLRKTCRVPSNSGGSGQSSSTRNMPVRSGQLGPGGSIFQTGGASNSSRLGLAEISNLTSSEGSTSDFDFLQETPSVSMRVSPFDRNSSMERKDSRVTSSRCLNRSGCWNKSVLPNVNRSLSDLIYEDGHEHVWIGTEENDATEVRAGPSSSLRSNFMNDTAGQPIILENDNGSTSDDSFATVSSMAGDLFDVDPASTSDSVLGFGPLLNQRSQELGSLRRGVGGQANNPSTSLGEDINISKPSMSKRKTSMIRTAGQVAGKSSSQESFNTVSGSGSKEKYVGRSSVGGTRRNFSKLGCTSASDTIPSTVSSFSAQCSEQSGNRRPDSGRRVIDGRDSARGQHKGKVPVASNTGGPVSRRTFRSELGVGQQCQASSTPRMSKKTVRATQPDPWRSEEIIGGDTVVELGLSNESISSSMRVLDQNGMLGNRNGARSPSSTVGRSTFGSLQRRHDFSHGVACTLGERVANRLSATTRRGASSSMASTHLFGLAGSSSRLNSICTESGSSSYSLLTEDEVGSNMTTISGPAPTRAPPLPPVSQSVRPQLSSSPSMALPFSGPTTPLRAPPLLPLAGSTSFASSIGTSSPSFLDGTTFVRSASVSDAPFERHMVAHSESNGRRAFRSLSIESDRRTQHTMEGLAEVLLALERIEQDEDLTYEQVLMLEANLLFGGINLHDQHSDMRLDIDNMSYEELLALQERIGSVSTGLTEDAILKCMKRIQFASDVVVDELNPVESEVKCSVCQLSPIMFNSDLFKEGLNIMVVPSMPTGRV